ncbi:MAG: hypothetical protein GC159_13625 [Phycisphaera sp.]|nr:hypothetical protein [Phycisphaera sp.]
MKLRSITLGLAIMLIGAASAGAQDAPKEKRYFSSNHRFLAQVVPVSPAELEEKKGKKPEVRVYIVEQGDQLKPYWKTELVNKYAPNYLIISDDGRHVITFDNWASIGRGDDVMAFYNSQGLLKKYSLEQALGVKSLPDDNSAIPHTDESRFWKQYYLEVFEQSKELPDGRIVPIDNPVYCLWLNHTPTWNCFDINTGERIQIDPRYAAYLNNKVAPSLTTLLDSYSSDRPMPYNIKTAVMFLGTLKRQQDNQMFRRFLVNEDFQTRYSILEVNGQEVPAFYTESSVRRIADRVFAYWQAQVPVEKLFDYKPGERYFYLGTVRGSIKLPDVPSQDTGPIYIYLVPAQADINQWAASMPRQEAVIDFRRATTAPLDPEFNFVFDGVLPGQYRVKVVWDKAQPFEAGKAAVKVPGKGDYENALGRAVINVQAHVTTTVDTIDVNQAR